MGDPLTLSREELYELVWSKPMVELAKDFGLSDVAVAKRCRKLGVPVPGRGYWARVAAGQTPRQAPLRKRAEQNPDYSTLTFDALREKADEAQKATDGPEHDVLRARIRDLPGEEPIELCHTSAVVKRTAVYLKRPWSKALIWNRAERSGPILRVEVSDSAADRALLLCERLLMSAQRLGWQFKMPAESKGRVHRYSYEQNPSSPPTFGQLRVENEALTFRIDERRRQVDHEPTEDEKRRRRRGEFVHAPRWDLLPAGELRLHVARTPEARYTSRTWKDRGAARLEDQIPSMLLGFLDEALRMKSDREQRRLAEIEQRRQDEVRWQQSQRRAANAKLIRELESQAGAWFRARLLRSYLHALRRATGRQKVEAKLQNARVDFIAWAQHYVDQLDPLSSTPHDPDLQSNRSGHSSESDEDKVERALSRLIGRHWQDAWKLGKLAPAAAARNHLSLLFSDPDADGIVFSSSTAEDHAH